MHASLILADARGRFLYEVRPDVFPEGFLTDQEIELWAKFYEWRKDQLPKRRR